MRATDAEHALVDAVAHALAAWPEEACGLLLGGPDRIVVATRRTANRARERDRFEIPPGELVRVAEDARSRGLDLVGVYHSHPDADPLPSAADTEGARCLWRDRPSWLYLILGVRAGVVTPRLWRFQCEWVEVSSSGTA
jgi:proteasome lid subunit RPN8/RPN11